MHEDKNKNSLSSAADNELMLMLDGTVRLIERKGGSKQSLKGGDEGVKPKFDLLTTNGKWRLVFTTGDAKTQKKIGGKLTYIPIKAVQVLLKYCTYYFIA